MLLARVLDGRGALQVGGQRLEGLGEEVGSEEMDLAVGLHVRGGVVYDGLLGEHGLAGGIGDPEAEGGLAGIEGRDVEDDDGADEAVGLVDVQPGLPLDVGRELAEGNLGENGGELGDVAGRIVVYFLPELGVGLLRERANFEYARRIVLPKTAQPGDDAPRRDLIRDGGSGEGVVDRDVGCERGADRVDAALQEPGQEHRALGVHGSLAHLDERIAGFEVVRVPSGTELAEERCEDLLSLGRDAEAEERRRAGAVVESLQVGLEVLEGVGPGSRGEVFIEGLEIGLGDGVDAAIDTAAVAGAAG